MKFSHFFIDRPIFATVLSLVILLGGGLALLTLPMSQYPEIVPPTVEVTARYPGADPKVIADTVATPIEQEVNGVQDMLYMSSQSTSDGTMGNTSARPFWRVAKRRCTSARMAKPFSLGSFLRSSKGARTRKVVTALLRLVPSRPEKPVNSTVWLTPGTLEASRDHLLAHFVRALQGGAVG